MSLLTKEKIAQVISEEKLTDWELREKEIEKQYIFKNFAEAMVFVNKVAEIAETLDHHPDIRIVWNKVNLIIATHSAGGLTEKDFQLAAKINGLAG